jgi:FHA domain
LSYFKNIKPFLFRPVMMHTNKTAYSFVLDDSAIQIGRDKACGLLLQGFGISRFHASLKLRKDTPEIIVNPDTSPVTVNNKQIHQALLCNDDILNGLKLH